MKWTGLCGSDRRDAKVYNSLTGYAVAAVMLVALLSHCARPMTPQGGPRDTLPPILVEATPAEGSTGFTGKRIVLQFDENIRLQDQQKNFFTSPFMKHPPTILQRNTSLQITINDTLLENQTYSINFGSSLVDNNENNPLTGLRYVFSTGELIDSMIMSGYTVDANRSDTVGNVFVLFFDPAADSVTDIAADTLPGNISSRDSTLFKASPLAVARSYPNGILIAENLKPMPYRIYAFEDNNSNQTYEAGVDRVAFLDSVYNPVEMEPFDIWFDTIRHYWQADPQLYLRLFMDTPYRRQAATGSSRPEQGKIQVNFSAPEPQIEEMVLEGIDPSRIVTEYQSSQKDTIYYWLDAATAIPDTVRGYIVYQKTDSLGGLSPDTLKLSLGWREPQLSRRERTNQERLAETDTVIVNTFKYTAGNNSKLNPEKPVHLKFDYPLTLIDSAAFELRDLTDEKTPKPMPFDLMQDTLRIREWDLAATWKEGGKYELFIPPGTLVNTRGETNDTIKFNMTASVRDDFGIIRVNVRGKSPESKYVVQLLGAGSTIVQEKRDVSTGAYDFLFVEPGEVRIRVIEDIDGNGRWDGGSLVKHIQPERAEMFVTESGVEEIEARVNWDLAFDIDMNLLFAPMTMDEMKRIIARRHIKFMEAVMKQREEARQRLQEQQGGSSGGMGMGSGMGMGGRLGGAMNNLGR